MTLFVIFVFGAVVLGAGAMLSPAMPTEQPRIALAATFALAIIIGGTIFYAMLFGWDILVIDYLLFALVVGIFLGGTLSVGQSRAEALGQVLEDKDQGWPGPQDLAIVVVIGLLFVLIVLIVPISLGTQGATESLTALLVREGQTLDTLAPFYPEFTYVHAPGFSALVAYLSQQLAQGIDVVQFDVGAVIGFLCIWLAYDLGGEQRDKRLGRTYALAMLFGLGVVGLVLEGYATSLTAYLFLMGFFIYLYRFYKNGYPVDAVLAGLLLGATLITQLDIFLIAVLAWFSLLFAVWLGEERPNIMRWAVMLVGVPIVAFIATAPWTLNTDFSLLNDTPSFERDSENMRIFIQNHAIWSFFAAIIGAWLGWIRRDVLSLSAVLWLLLIFDYSVTGGLSGLFPFLLDFADPQLVARVGPILPYSMLGGSALLWLFNNYVVPRTGAITYRGTYILAGIGTVVVIILTVIVLPQMRSSSVSLPPAHATSNDLAVLAWIREELVVDRPEVLDDTDDDADNESAEAREVAPMMLILNPFMGDSGIWAAVVSEQQSIYLPPLPYGQSDQLDIPDFGDFWDSPTDSVWGDELRDAGVTHVFVPEILSAGVDLDALWRFGAPFTFAPIDLELVDYLALLHEVGEARLYAVVSATD